MPKVPSGLTPREVEHGGVLAPPGGWPIDLIEYRERGERTNLSSRPGPRWRTTGVAFPRAGRHLALGQPKVIQIRRVPPAPAPLAQEETRALPEPWTNDNLTPRYTDCRLGYPGGRNSGVYWWRPIPC
jgi:hypothetical protein